MHWGGCFGIPHQPNQCSISRLPVLRPLTHAAQRLPHHGLGRCKSPKIAQTRVMGNNPMEWAANACVPTHHLRQENPSNLYAVDPGPWQGGFDVSSAAVIATSCGSAPQLTRMVSAATDVLNCRRAADPGAEQGGVDIQCRHHRRRVHWHLLRHHRPRHRLCRSHPVRCWVPRSPQTPQQAEMSDREYGCLLLCGPPPCHCLGRAHPARKLPFLVRTQKRHAIPHKGRAVCLGSVTTGLITVFVIWCYAAIVLSAGVAIRQPLGGKRGSSRCRIAETHAQDCCRRSTSCSPPPPVKAVCPQG